MGFSMIQSRLKYSGDAVAVLKIVNPGPNEPYCDLIIDRL